MKIESIITLRVSPLEGQSPEDFAAVYNKLRADVDAQLAAGAGLKLQPTDVRWVVQGGKQ
jgi:hypothetical protein